MGCKGSRARIPPSRPTIFKGLQTLVCKPVSVWHVPRRTADRNLRCWVLVYPARENPLGHQSSASRPDRRAPQAELPPRRNTALRLHFVAFTVCFRRLYGYRRTSACYAKQRRTTAQIPPMGGV